MNLYELVVNTAARHGDRLAVSGPSGTLTYAELDRRADALAARLRAAGVRRGDRVLIWAEKSPEVIAAMQAVLRLGAAYVPATGATPPERVALMARDCGASALCVASPDGAAGLLPELPRVSIAPAGTPAEVPDAPRIAEPVAADDLAYILYTSGSTGAPKGVCVSHRNARAFVDWVVAELRPSAEDRFANHAPLTFDLSVLDLYAPFSVGASTHLVPSELAYAPGRLAEFVYEHDISVWYSVPSALAMMIRDGGLLARPAPSRLRAILFAGEPFAVDDVRALASWSPARLLNLYGPTETNVCTFHEVRPADLERDRPVPIGLPASDDAVWAETPEGRIGGPGDEGELVVDGPTVMLGYWGRPRHRGPYHTGDIVRVLPDGVFDYVGRRDQMVKVRGNRVELGEVEAVLGTHSMIDQVAVAVAGSGPAARLVAFVVPEDGEPPGLLALKRHCAQRLPTYMIVDEARVVAALPRTGNGKVDRSALAAGLVEQPAGERGAR